MWDLRSLTRDQTCTPCTGRRSQPLDCEGGSLTSVLQFSLQYSKHLKYNRMIELQSEKLPKK